MSKMNGLLTNDQLYTIHNNITYYMFFVWFGICILGYLLKNKVIIKNNISIILVVISIIQEIFDYINRFFINDLYIPSLENDLPFHLCHFAYWLSVLCLLILILGKNSKKIQMYFNCAYFFGFSGALQGILTVDLTNIFTLNDILALQFQHSFIILNVLWIIFAYNLKFNQKGIIQVFIIINILAIFVGLINLFLNTNYMFLCNAPDVNNPLLIGKWPIYLIFFEIFFFLYGYLLYFPFKIIKLINGKNEEI